jgi:hypothetical protein
MFYKDGVSHGSWRRSTMDAGPFKFNLSSRLPLGILVFCFIYPAICGKAFPYSRLYEKRAGQQVGVNVQKYQSSSSSLQITATPSVCSSASGESEGTAGYIHLDQSRALFFWYHDARWAILKKFPWLRLLHSSVISPLYNLLLSFFFAV